jgi:membrane-associated phospholipid phosphatase
MDETIKDFEDANESSEKHSLRRFFNKYSHIWTVIYLPIYLVWFGHLEKTVTTDFHLIHIKLDDLIPFVDVFIIPYLLWFLFVAATLIYLFFHSKQEYYDACKFLFTGMTLFLIICTIYPNGLTLRENITYNNSIFSHMVKFLHQADTSTNVFPSIHVYNTIGCCIALFKSSGLDEHKWLKIATGTLGIFIILSTVFLKQHSIVDVVGAVVMAGIMYFVVYHKGLRCNDKASKSSHTHQKRD